MFVTDLKSPFESATDGNSALATTDGYAAGSYMVRGLSSSTYHGDKEVASCSMLKTILISPGHFLSSMMSLGTSSVAKDFGSLVHALVLEPHLVGSEFAVFPGIYNGRSSEYKGFVANCPGRLVVDEPTFSCARRLSEKILHRIVFGRPFGDYVSEGTAEPSIYFNDPVTGARLKIRPDLMHPEFTFDLKTTRHPTVAEFVRDCFTLNYDLQAYMYSLGRALYDGTDSAKPFVFIAAESDSAHSIHQVTAGESFLSNGMKKYNEALKIYASCRQVGHFPDSSANHVIEVPYWNQFVADTHWQDSIGSLHVEST